MSQSISYFKKAIVLFFLFGPFPNYVLAQTNTETIEPLLRRLTLEQKIGQLFMIGFSQGQIDKKLKDLVTKVRPGSFLLFKRNIASASQVKKLNQDLRLLSLQTSGVAPFIAVDQEGGVVSRVPISTPLPSALALGQANSLSIAETYGEEVGHLIKDLGFNMNLAPVLDLSDPQQPSFIGVRSLGPNPQRVAELGVSISKGLMKSKVIPTAKHFPGLGSSLHDPHTTLVTRMINPEEFFITDLRPFQKFSELGAESAVMLSHLSYPFLDPANVPALFSEKIVQGILRQKLGFKGIAITDDIMMEGSSQFAQPEDAALMALKAGADIIMVTWSSRSQEKAFRRIKEAVDKKELSLKEIDEKVHRILLAKSRVMSVGEVSQERVLASKSPATTDRLHKIEQTILESNIKQQISKLLSVKTSPSLCIASSHRGFLESFKKGSRFRSKYIYIPTNTNPGSIDSTLKHQACTQIILPIYGKKTAALISSLSSETKARTLLVNFAAPMAGLDEASFLAVLNLYFPHLNAGQKIAQHIDQKK